jgi:plasmid maintenance system antidote protein VapI
MIEELVELGKDRKELEENL